MTPSAAAASVQGTRRNTPVCARNQASAGFGAPDSNVAQSNSGEPMPTLSIQVATARGALRTRRSCHLWRAANCAPTGETARAEVLDPNCVGGLCQSCSRQ